MCIVNIPDMPNARVLHCLDRVVLTGTAVGLHYTEAMVQFLNIQGIHKSGFTAWAGGITEDMKRQLKELASHLKIDYVPWKTKYGRKDDLAKKAMSKHNRFGPILVVESFETCRTYKFPKVKEPKRDFYAITSKCLYYYIYINYPHLGLVHVRIQSYAPYPIQVIVNGHRILERLLLTNGVDHKAVDNAVISCSNIPKAQELSDSIDSDFLNSHVKRLVNLYLPIMNFLPSGYRITIRQIEYSSDILFVSNPDLHSRYTSMIPRLMQHAPTEVLRFIQCEGTRPRSSVESRYYQTRFGSCVKFTLGNISIKAYTKDIRVLRIETTCRDLRSLRGLRTVFHKDGTRSIQRRQLTRSIHDLQLFINYAHRANMRFLESISHALSFYHESRILNKATVSKRLKGRTYKGFNFFDAVDQRAIKALTQPGLDLLPFSRKALMHAMGDITPYQASHVLRRMRSHGLIRRLPSSHQYYPTTYGKKVCATMHYLSQEVITPIVAA